MDMIMTTAIAFTAIGGMVVFALSATEQKLPIRIRVEERKRRF